MFYLLHSSFFGIRRFIYGGTVERRHIRMLELGGFLQISGQKRLVNSSTLATSVSLPVNNPVGDTIDSHKSLTSPPQTCWKSTFFPAAGPDMPRNKSQKKFYWDLLLLLYLFPVLVMFQKVFWWILSGKNFHYTARKTDTRSSPTDVRHKSQEEIKDMTNHCNIVTNIIVTF